MGVAAYNRGSNVIREQIAAQERPVEFVMMDNLNAIPKYEDAGTPSDTIHFGYDERGVWWAECPKTGFGYFYKSLREAVRRWRVVIRECRNGVWIADPMPPERLTIDALMKRR
jgi:hypothetical protein